MPQQQNKKSVVLVNTRAKHALRSTDYPQIGQAETGVKYGQLPTIAVRPEDWVVMTRKSLKVDRKQFEGIVKSLLQSPHVKREDVKVSKKKPEKLIPAQK